MTATIRTVLNCVLVAAATLAGVLVYVSLPALTLEPLQWAGQHMDRPLAMTFWFVYSVLVWAVIAGLVASCMLLLRPGNVFLYGLVSAATFIIAGQSWSLGSAYAFSRELILALAIPVLYWALVRWKRKRHGKSSGADCGIPGAG